MKLSISAVPNVKRPYYEKFTLLDIPVGVAFRYSGDANYLDSMGVDKAIYIKLPNEGPRPDGSFWPVIKIDPNGWATVGPFDCESKWYFFEVEVNVQHADAYPIGTKFC